MHNLYHLDQFILSLNFINRVTITARIFKNANRNCRADSTSGAAN